MKKFKLECYITKSKNSVHFNFLSHICDNKYWYFYYESSSLEKGLKILENYSYYYKTNYVRSYGGIIKIFVPLELFLDFDLCPPEGFDWIRYKTKKDKSIDLFNKRIHNYVQIEYEKNKI